MGNLKIRVVSEPSEKNPFIVIYKPHNLPSAPLSKDDKNNALFQAGQLFPEVFSIRGRKEIEYGLIHRLDTVTAGLILIAVNQDFYDRMLKIQAEDKFVKYYSAECDICTDNAITLKGFPPFSKSSSDYKSNDNVYTKSFFRSFGDGSKEVRPVTEKSGMAAIKKLKSKTEYETEIKIKRINEADQTAKVICKISKGYRHQVRCHLAWTGLPVINDPLYNSRIKNLPNPNNGDIKFEAIGFEFPHPFSDSGEIIFFGEK